MAKCAYCRAETEKYDGDDVPVCIECRDETKRKPFDSEHQIRNALHDEVWAACAGLRSGVCGKVISHTSAMEAIPKSPLRAAIAIRIVRPFRRTVAKLYGLRVETEGYLMVKNSPSEDAGDHLDPDLGPT